MDISADIPNALALLDVQIEALFTHDAGARIHRSNEPPPNSLAPRFFLGRTTEGNRWRFRYDLPNALVQNLLALARSEPVAANLHQPTRNLEQFRAVLARHAPIKGGAHGPAYHFPASIERPSNVVLIDQTNLALLRDMEPDLERFARYLHLMSPCAVVVEHDRAVSMCFCSRLTPLAAEAGLETMLHARGRGYAVAVVAAWAHAVRASGRIPLYSTSWDNLASQGVARRLGLILYAENLSFS